MVLFSAAIPHQGGDDHINEQWPGYWAKLFARCNYVTVDCLRDHFWDDEEVAYYYAQNMLLYVDSTRLSDYPGLVEHVVDPEWAGLARIHPSKWMHANNPANLPLKMVLAALPTALGRAIRRRLPRF